MQIGITHIIGSVIAIMLLISVAFVVGTKWTEPEAQTVSASKAIGDVATSSEEITVNAEETLFDVIKVVDGDTIAVRMNGKSETIRLIGIDTPETSDPRMGVQCFGREATDELKALLTNSSVSIERDPEAGERDKYNRLLAYIFREDGLLVNKELITQGYAHEYTYKNPYKYQKEFKAAQADAKAQKRGLWAPDACPEPIKATAPAPAKVVTPAPMSASASQSPEEVQSQPEPAPQPKEVPKQETKVEPSVEPSPAPSSSVVYTCSSNTYNCSDFKAQAEAQAVFNQCGGVSNDVHKLDNNKDGEACESLP